MRKPSNLLTKLGAFTATIAGLAVAGSLGGRHYDAIASGIGSIGSSLSSSSSFSSSSDTSSSFSSSQSSGSSESSDGSSSSDKPECPKFVYPATVLCPVEVLDIEETSVWISTATQIHVDGPKDAPTKSPLTILCKFCRDCLVTVGDADGGREPSCQASGLDFESGCEMPPQTTTNRACTDFSFTISAPSDETWKKAKEEDFTYFSSQCTEFLNKNPKKFEELSGVCTEENLENGGATYTDHDGECCDRNSSSSPGSEGSLSSEATFH